MIMTSRDNDVTRWCQHFRGAVLHFTRYLTDYWNTPEGAAYCSCYCSCSCFVIAVAAAFIAVAVIYFNVADAAAFWFRSLCWCLRRCYWYFSAVFPIQVNYSRTEVNPQFVSIVPHSEIVIVVTFDIEIARAPMSITVCVPYSMIEPIRTKLNAGFQIEQDEKDNTWSNRFKQNLQ